MEVLNVLVVDDEPGIRSGVSRILRNFTVGYPFMDEDISYNVLEAATGEEAIEIINREQTDIVLLDNKLPGMQGIEVLEYINENQPQILVMMITSYASLELAVKATNNGAYDFVPKPFTPQELRSSMETITKHLFLKRMTRELKREGKQIRFQFLTMLSHELKAPLNAVEGYLRIMQEGQAGDQIENYSKMIDRSLERIHGMRSLIMDLLDLTQIESGKRKREMSEVRLKDVANNSVDTIKPYAVQNDVHVNLHIKNSELTYLADKDEMEIILNNLVSNAVKYNVKGGEVNCYISENNSAIEIKVQDSGIGMSEDEIGKLFNEFVRIKNSKTKNISGSGLGLSIVKRIVDFYKGSIDVSSEPDKGSVFTIYLPR